MTSVLMLPIMVGLSYELIRFAAKQSDYVAGGTVGDFPLVARAQIAPANVKFDQAAGLFGLAVVRREGLLESAAGRAAIAQAIDRNLLIHLEGSRDPRRFLARCVLGARAFGFCFGLRWSWLGLRPRRFGRGPSVLPVSSVTGLAKYHDPQTIRAQRPIH